ncbi:MAG: hypothetical protein ACPGRZ_07025 [Alphaproteobacteria bacterium]
MNALINFIGDFTRSPEEQQKLREENRRSPPSKFYRHYNFNITGGEKKSTDALTVKIDNPSGGTSTPTPAPATSGADTGPDGIATGGREQVKIDQFKERPTNFYISVSVANSDRDEMTKVDFSDGFESGDTTHWSSTLPN